MADSNYTTPPQYKQTVEALWRLEKLILDTLDFKNVVQRIVDSVLTELGYLNLGYRIVVLVLYDKKNNALQRVSISQTEEARTALALTPIPFPQIEVPLSAANNLCVQVFNTKQAKTTKNWPDILCPPFSEAEAKQIQDTIGIKSSLVYPVISKEEPLGVMIFSLIKQEEDISSEEKDLLRSFTDIVGLAVQSSELYTSLDKTTQELKAANDKLKQMDKLKDEFISIVSHELRTPMTAIRSYAWMVIHERGGKLEPKAMEYMNRVYLSTERLIDLVNDMLDVSRIESGRVQLKSAPFDMVQLANEVQSEFQARSTERDLQVLVEYHGKIPQIMGDREKVHQVLENLVGNAFKFTPNGGKITMDICEKDGMILTGVMDTGKGIAAEDIQKLFTKFGRLDNSLVSISESGGTGLGLYISKQYIEMHKGKIWAESEVGKGTTFFFTLPKA